MKKAILTICIICMSALSAFCQTPQIGDTKVITTTVCRIDVGARDRKNFNESYGAPAGWQILSFDPVVVSKRQHVAYSFSQLPSNYTSLSKATIDTKFKELTDLAAQKNAAQKYEARLNQMRNDFERYYSMETSTHSKITTKGSVKGNGMYAGKPGRLYLNLKITLVYMPDKQEQFLQSIEYLKQVINAEG